MAIGLVLIAFVVWSDGVTAAHAGTDVLVIGEGSAERAQVVAVRGAIENALRKAGWVWPARAPSRREAEGLLKCQDSSAPWSCIPPSISGLRAHQVRRALVVLLEPRPSDTAGSASSIVVITGRIIVNEHPQSFAVRQRHCQGCTEGELAAASEDLITELLRELIVRSGTTTVAIRSVPQGARIELDGVFVGMTDGTFNTFPGTHVARIEAPGFAPETREVMVVQDQTTSLDVTMRPAAAPPPLVEPDPPAKRAAPTARRSYLVPAVAAASGAALLGFSGVAFYYGRKAGPAEPYRYTRATSVGVVSGVLGAAAIGAAIYTWRSPRRSGPVGTLSRGGILVGWSGGF